jgi:Zn-dependent alcohol dehydrogenase
MGSFIGPHTMQATVNLLASGKLELENLITHKITLSQFGIGLEAMRKGEAIEVIILPDNE